MFIVNKMLFPFINLVLTRKSVETVSSNGCWEDRLVQRCVDKLPQGMILQGMNQLNVLHLMSSLQGGSHNFKICCSNLAERVKIPLFQQTSNFAIY